MFCFEAKPKTRSETETKRVRESKLRQAKQENKVKGSETNKRSEPKNIKDHALFDVSETDERRRGTGQEEEKRDTDAVLNKVGKGGRRGTQ